MSVLIPGMEMPKRCGECPLSLYPHSPCWQNGGALDWENRPNWCPLVPVPPHGRCIDADALINKIGENVDKAKDRNYDWWYACTVAYDFALAAPTIIPASEEGE